MFLLSRYLLKNAALTTLTIAVGLTLIIWLTQSLRLLDLIINGGAPMGLFGRMLLLTVPKFFEIILPISMALGILYSLNRFSTDSELVVMQNTGISPLRLGSGILGFALLIATIVFLLSGWMTPLANRELDRLRDVVRTDYSVGLLRPGIFNTLGKEATIYIADRNGLRDLRGIFIHFNPQGEPASTITAKNGGLLMQDGKPFVVMFDGTRQQFNPQNGSVETLHFERYSVNLSSFMQAPTTTRFDPDNGTLRAILSVKKESLEPARRAQLQATIHDRLSRPVLTLALALLTLTPYLIGRFNRRGHYVRILSIVVGILILQSAHLLLTPLTGKSF